jgi:hypothetical protein
MRRGFRAMPVPPAISLAPSRIVWNSLVCAKELQTDYSTCREVKPLKPATLILRLSLPLGLILAMADMAQAAPLCPRLYKPVCGVTSASGIATYTNSCEAKKAGATVLHEGKCQGPGQARCPHIAIHPVCAKNIKTGIEKTYDNLCWAEKDWASFVHNGRC